MENAIEQSKAIRKALQQIPIARILHNKKTNSFRPLLSMHEDTPIMEFLNILSQNGFLSSPIYRTTTDGYRIYSGIISIYDVLSFAIFEEIFDQSQEWGDSTLMSFLNRINTEEFFNVPVSKLIGATSESANPWILYSTDSITDLIDLFTNNQHRVLVIDSEVLEKSLTSPIPASASLTIVSQSDVVRYLYDCRSGTEPLDRDLLEPLWDLTVSQLAQIVKDPSQPVVAMFEQHSALHGFRTMYLDNLTGLPVIDASGNVVANLSASDLRGISLENIKHLQQPVFEYLQTVKRRGEVPKVDQVRTIERDQTMDQCVQIILTNYIHRLWITENNSEKLSGAVSLTDILSLFK